MSFNPDGNVSRYKTKFGIKKECRDTRVENIDTLASTSDFQIPVFIPPYTPPLPSSL